MIPLSDKPNVVSPSSTYPYGAIKDNPGDGSGTPVNTKVYGDFHQFFAKLFADSGLTANGLADNATNGFQLFQAFINSGNNNFIADLITGILGSYTADDLIILWGCNVSVVGSTYTITSGAIFYNGVIYKVSGSSVTVTVGNVMVYKINSSVQPNVIYIDNDASLSGIADYGASNVKYMFGWNTSTSTSGISFASPTGVTVNSLTRKWTRIGNTVTLKFDLSLSITGSGSIVGNFPLPIAGKNAITEYQAGFMSVGGSIKIIGVGMDNAGGVSSSVALADSSGTVTGNVSIGGTLIYEC